MANPYRSNRQFERLLFRGVPEHAETIWERDTNAIVTDRCTGKSQLEQLNQNDQDLELIAKINFKPLEKKVEVIHVKDTEK
jgi:hypothetical protein